ncbi:HlyD family secretion protein [uncultured Thiomicrorhabdus sp.]
MNLSQTFPSLLLALSALGSSNTLAQTQSVYNGYIEAEYTYLAPPSSGWLQILSVRAGDQVKQDQALFALDNDFQELVVTQASAQLEQAQANLTDLQLGARSDEIKSLQAQLAEAEATLKLTESEKERWTRLAEHGNASKSQKDQAVQAWQVASAKVRNLKATLHLAQLGAREEQIHAAQANVKAAESSLEQAKWQLHQRTVLSPLNGRVEQVFHRQGEYVSANTPVLSLITPQQLKVKFYVPEYALSDLQVGESIRIHWDGRAKPLPATISYISNVAEFTPPLIFSQKFRQKLVYLIEAKLSDGQLRPGQPVDVSLPSETSAND